MMIHHDEGICLGPEHSWLSWTTAAVSGWIHLWRSAPGWPWPLPKPVQSDQAKGWGEWKEARWQGLKPGCRLWLMGSRPLAGLMSLSLPNSLACGWQKEPSGYGELVMRYGAIHLQVTSSKPGQHWVEVSNQGWSMVSGLKADICPPHRQLRQVSLGHRARSSVPGDMLCKPKRPPCGACPSGSVLPKTRILCLQARSHSYMLR